jgi:hypothetical protein
MTSLRVANTRGFDFTPNWHKSTISNFLRITIMGFWQFAVNRGRVLADRIKMVWDLPQWKKTVIFYNGTSQKCKYVELKLMLGFQIRIRLETDLFDWIEILQGAMAVCIAIFHARIPTEFRVVANPQNLRSLILHLWKHCSTDWLSGRISGQPDIRCIPTLKAPAPLHW